MEQKTQCKLKKDVFFLQITDVLYTMSFRDMLGWDKSKKMHPKYITFNLCHCYKAKNCPQLTKKSVPSC